MKQKSIKIYSFTLLELLLVTVILGFIMPIMILVYSFLIKSNKEIIARQTAIQQWYEFFERLNILMKDYTIDYEEYFNRQMVWCVEEGWKLLTWANFKWNIWTKWHCTEFTSYWNKNTTQRITGVSSKIDSDYHDVYTCSSNVSSSAPSQWNILWRPRALPVNLCWEFWVEQSFWQYRSLFTDVKDIRFVNDDEELWKIINNKDIKAIRDSENVQELYLISHDWKSRLFFRRTKIREDHYNEYAQYRVQILRLRWFDAWQKHNFDATDNEWLYDWKIDTWACDTSMWFVWKGDPIWWAYNSYHLPKDADDCWADLTYWKTNLYTRTMEISPSWDPELYWADQDRQVNPYMKMLIVNGVYLPELMGDNIPGSSIMDFKVPITTTINMKDFYRE